MEEKIFTRRDFLRGATGAAVAAALGPGILGEAHSPPERLHNAGWNPTKKALTPIAGVKAF